MALPVDQLRLPRYLRYRLALAVLPSLAWARSRFVARVVHRDPAGWSAAVADLIHWHSTATDEAAEWPGRAAQEKQVLAAGGDGGEDDSGSGNSGDTGAVAGADAAADETAGNASGGPAADGAKQSKPSGTPG
jgi:hypothetical protein